MYQRKKLQFKEKNNHTRAAAMLFLWIGSQNYKVFLFGSGYRSASSDKVIIKW